MSELTIECQCGTIHGAIYDIEKKSGERVRCYCRDCQSYAHYLGQAKILLDAHGGTGMYVTTPQGIAFTQGQDQLACLQLSPQGPLRWYARCCNTPLGNTIKNPRLPFVSLPLICVKADVESAFGPKELGIFAKDAHGTLGKPASSRMSPWAALRVAYRLLRARIRGETKRSAYFDAAGQPRSRPTLIGKDDRREALKQAGFA